MFTDLVLSCSREVVLVKQKMPKKYVASKRPWGSTSSDYDRTRFISTDVEGRFNASVTKRSGIKERGFEIDVDNTKVEVFQRVIHSHGW